MHDCRRKTASLSFVGDRADRTARCAGADPRDIVVEVLETIHLQLDLRQQYKPFLDELRELQKRLRSFLRDHQVELDVFAKRHGGTDEEASKWLISVAKEVGFPDNPDKVFSVRAIQKRQHECGRQDEGPRDA